MTMRINDLIRINILALSAILRRRGSGLDFGLGVGERAALAARAGGSDAWRTVTAGGTTRGCDGASGWFDSVSSAQNFLEPMNATNRRRRAAAAP